MYSANHYRAILDMIYRTISRGGIPYHLDIDGWLDSEEQKEMFFHLIDQYLPKFSPPSPQKILELRAEMMSSSSIPR